MNACLCWMLLLVCLTACGKTSKPVPTAPKAVVSTPRPTREKKEPQNMTIVIYPPGTKTIDLRIPPQPTHAARVVEIGL